MTLLKHEPSAQRPWQKTMLGLFCSDILVLSVEACVHSEALPTGVSVLLSHSTVSPPVDQLIGVEESSASGTSTRSTSRSAASFRSSSTPTNDILGIPKL